MSTDVVVVGAHPERITAQLHALTTREPLDVTAIERADVTALAAFVGRDGNRAVALLVSDLAANDEVLLGLLERPELQIGALIGEADAHPVASQGSQVLSAATPEHRVDDPDGGFLGGLWVTGPLRAKVAGAIAGAAAVTGDPVDVALAAIVRCADLPSTTAVRPAPFPASRGGRPDGESPQGEAVLRGDTAALFAARHAARPGDGAYSTFVLRRLSARVTPLAVRYGVHPNTVTLLSLLAGLAGSGLFCLGDYPALVAGALLLQVSLVLDCVDGEIARATRSGSRFGGWLDAATDRVKEYAALAGLAVAADGAWRWALVAMAVQTARHIRDFSFDKGVLATWRAGLRDVRPLTDTTPWTRPAGAGRGPEPLTGSPGLWLRRIIRMPIGERWLVVSIAALADAPKAGVLAYLVLVALGELWSLAGALRHSGATVGAYGDELRQRLAAYRDDGLLGVLTHRVRPSGVVGWLLPALTMLAESAAALAACLASPGGAFAWLAVVVWHRYDVIYRRSTRESDVPAAVSLLGLGWFVRTGVLAAAAATGSAYLVVGGACWLAAVYVPESLVAGLRTKGRSGS
jgi:hypothetical protein